MSGEGEIALLREDLRDCRLDLARERQSHEPLLEELARVRHELERARARSKRLSEKLNELLTHLPAGSSPPRRLARYLVRRGRASPAEWQQVLLLRHSPLFDGPWYLRRYPQAVESGLEPELHYLRHGAGEGFDPSPRFRTRHYLSDHPGLAESGENPLVHRLRAGSADPAHGRP